MFNSSNNNASGFNLNNNQNGGALGAGSSLFGGANNNALGTQSNNANAQQGSSFGNTAFGGSATSGGLFGKDNNKTPSFSFGSSNTNSAAGSNTANTNAATNSVTTGQFGGFGTSSQTAPKQSFGGFGGSSANTGTGTGGFSFGAPKSTDNANSASTTESKGFGGFGGFGGLGASKTDSTSSTADGASSKNSLFGNQKPAEAPKLSFGSSSTGTGGLFGNTSGNKTDTSSTVASQQPTQSQSLFGNASATGSTGADKPTFGFGQQKASSEQKPSLFGASSATTNSTSNPAPSLFGKTASTLGSAAGKEEEAKNTSANLLSAKPDAKPFSFGGSVESSNKNEPSKLVGVPASDNTNDVKKDDSKPAASGFSFGSLSAKPAEEKKENTNTAPVSTGFSFAKAEPKESPKEATKTTPTGSSKPAFGFGTNAPSTTDPSSSTSTTGAADAASSTKTAPFSLGKSSTGAENSSQPPSMASSVQVQPGEYLKNKSFEDIIAKWTSALTKSVERFKEQAGQTSKWDQILVDNGSKIADIYNEITVAEQAQNRIDDVLSYVGRQQDDIDAILSQLEKQTSSANASALALNNLQPVDKERYHAYNLADQLNSKLDTLEDSLGSIIGEMNTLTRESHNVKESDPIAQIVKILNSHLASLQSIDESASSLQKKLVEAHSQTSQINI